MKLSDLNLFHDWVLTALTYSDDLILSLEKLDDKEKHHLATITFSGATSLEFTDYQQPVVFEKSDFDIISKLASDRWIQRISQTESQCEIELIGGNDHTDSHVAVIRFEFDSIEEFVDNK